MFVVKQLDSNNGNELLYRASFTNVEEALKWLNEEYKKETRSEWVVDRTFPNTERYVYRHIFVCNLSNKNKKKGSRRTTKCPAQLEIKIKKISKDTKKKDPLIGKHEPPLPGIITITNKHNHNLETFDCMRFLRSGNDIRKVFEDYFNYGLSRCAARKIHWDKVRQKQAGTADVADRHVLPARRTVYYWYSEWFRNNFGDPVDPLQKLEEKVESYERDGNRIAIKRSSPWAILIATPIMIRSQTLKTSEEIIFVDTTGTCDTTHSNVTLLPTATKVGAVPIAVLMHESQTTESYKDAFSLPKSTFPNCFGGKQSPAVFMTDHSTAEKQALSEIWSTAVQLLCHFHVGQQEWTWLTQSKNGVDSSERQALIKAFQKIMYGKTTGEFEESLEEFRNEVKNERYKRRVENFLDLLYLLMRGHHTNNLAEATMRILKDIILERVKAYNVVALADYIINVWNTYLEARIMKILHKMDNTPQLLYAAILNAMSPELAEKIEQVDEDTFIVPSAASGQLTYEVQTSVGWCLCTAGTSGAFCKHQALVHSRFGGVFPNAPTITSFDRYQLGQLALGDKCPPPTYFLDMQGDPNVIQTWELETSSIADFDEVPIVGEPIPMKKKRNVDDFSQDQKAEIVRDFMKEWERLHNVAEGEENYYKYLQSCTQTMKRMKTSASVTGAALRVSHALRQHISRHRRGKIGVQATSTFRRSNGAPKTSNRLPPGRPKGKKRPFDETQGCSRPSVGRPNKGDKRKPRRPHILEQSIMANSPHERKH